MYGSQSLAFIVDEGQQDILLAKQRIAARVPRALLMGLLDPLGELERLILGCEI